MPLLEPLLAWLEALVPDGLVELVLLVCAATHVAHTNSNNPDNRRFLIVLVFLLVKDVDLLVQESAPDSVVA